MNSSSNRSDPAWRRWGPYLAERQWGTVREDFTSTDGDSWSAVTHDMARSWAYRFGEEGIAGICDEQQYLCFALALWNERDPILKERLFGLANNEGNHGEDPKEYYYYLDNTPLHSFMQLLYKYPQLEYPYAQLVTEGNRRSKSEPEYELIDTGILKDNRYFDILISYAKVTPEDLCIEITAYNRASTAAPVHLIPTVWFRNIWQDDPHNFPRPRLSQLDENTILATHHLLGEYFLTAEGNPAILFCENETNAVRFRNELRDNRTFKDGINDLIVNGDRAAVSTRPHGTKAGMHFSFKIPANSCSSIRLRLSRTLHERPFFGFSELMHDARDNADKFYSKLQAHIESADERLVQRQAIAGMLWTKQFYYFDVNRWLGSDHNPTPRNELRNTEWRHLKNADIISMPDKWEYPWYAAWDLAFHCISLVMVDPSFAKEQLLLMTSERYMHPNGQLPAYEWEFSNVNPPVHAWASWRVYKIERKETGIGDIAFLERVFHKLMINFTWWVNRKDQQGRNIFQGGFLGLDNIGVFDRSKPLPTGGTINQADGTSWMAMYSLNLMRIALELARYNPAYEDIATKFFEHFLHIAHAMTDMAGKGVGLWDEQDEFYYDELISASGETSVLRVRSIVGLIPLFAVEVLEPELLEQVPGFHKRLRWLLRNEPHLASLVSRWSDPGRGERRLLSLLRGHRMKCLLKRMLDPNEFLSDYGIRALSAYHRDHPFVFNYGGESYSVGYQPGESDSWLFGGNSNWRGPIWFPINYLIIESLQKFHYYYGDDFTVECPTGSGNYLTISQIADEISRRLKSIFLKNENGARPCFGNNTLFQNDPHFRNHLLFHEYFNGDTGEGLGASHQTGWTGLIARLLQPRRDSNLHKQK